MKLYINTTDSQKIEVGLGEKSFTTHSKKERAQKLLPFIVEVLAKEGKELSAIDSIDFEEGPGSFTGLRVGLSVAYALALHYKIPINGKKVWEGELVDLKYD